MAISEQIQGNNTYIIYGYGFGGKNYRIYCGKKGLASTERKIKAAKKKHFDARVKYMREKMLEK